MCTHWDPDEEQDEMELDLDQEYAFSRFMSEAGGVDAECHLEEQERDTDRLASADRLKNQVDRTNEDS